MKRAFLLFLGVVVLGFSSCVSVQSLGGTHTEILGLKGPVATLNYSIMDVEQLYEISEAKMLNMIKGIGDNGVVRFNRDGFITQVDFSVEGFEGIVKVSYNSRNQPRKISLHKGTINQLLGHLNFGYRGKLLRSVEAFMGADRPVGNAVMEFVEGKLKEINYKIEPKNAQGSVLMKYTDNGVFCGVELYDKIKEKSIVKVEFKQDSLKRLNYIGLRNDAKIIGGLDVEYEKNGKPCLVKILGPLNFTFCELDLGYDKALNVDSIMVRSLMPGVVSFPVSCSYLYDEQGNWTNLNWKVLCREDKVCGSMQRVISYY